MERSQVAQCNKPGPLPVMVPETGINTSPEGANFTTPLWTYDVKEAVDVRKRRRRWLCVASLGLWVGR